MIDIIRYIKSPQDVGIAIWLVRHKSKEWYRNKENQNIIQEKPSESTSES